MLKSILELNGVDSLSKEQQKSINGGLVTWCRRRSTNVTQNGVQQEEGWQNENGCWIYPGMNWNSHPNCPPGSTCHTLGGQYIFIQQIAKNVLCLLSYLLNNPKKTLLLKLK